MSRTLAAVLGFAGIASMTFLAAWFCSRGTSPVFITMFGATVWNCSDVIEVEFVSTRSQGAGEALISSSKTAPPVISMDTDWEFLDFVKIKTDQPWSQFVAI
jgi:hypothetical protein